MSDGAERKLGLRERKKIKTRATIRMTAMRLFREQGYQATTVEQIAEASEISPSTFFRYYASKESVVTEDDYDPMLIEAYRAQPLGIPPIQALRNALRDGFSRISQDDREGMWERISLNYSVPELRGAALTQVISTAETISLETALRNGKSAPDLKTRAFASAVVGVVIAAQMHYIDHPEREFVDIVDEALALMDEGFPL
ncbi:MAG: TetR family transcriptional regulator [Paenibacillaceae bacterium]|nr:TetR family transcriptional regulator [Paenibacillaceae bacterium]